MQPSTIAQNPSRSAGAAGRGKTARRWLPALAAVALTALAASAQTQRVEVVIEDRAVVSPAGGVIRVTEGARVELVFHSDEGGELHLHGYDVAIPLDPRAPRTVTIDARATGRFPVTSHGFGAEAGRAHGHQALLFLEVHPR